MHRLILLPLAVSLCILPSCKPEQNNTPANAQQAPTGTPSEQIMDNNTPQEKAAAKCAATHFHENYEEETIICAIEKDDVEKMRKLSESVVENRLQGKKFKTDEDMIAAIREVQPKFHVIYPIASLDEIETMEEKFRVFAPYATTFEVQFVNDEPNNTIEKRIHFDADSVVAYRRFIFSGQTPKPTVVNKLSIDVQADTVVVYNLKMIHDSPGAAISVNINKEFIADSVVFEDTKRAEAKMKFAAQPLIVTFSRDNEPYDITIKDSIFRNNKSNGILGYNESYVHPVKNIKLHKVDITNNKGSLDISASESVLVEECTISQDSHPALTLRTPKTKVTIQDSKLGGYVFKYHPLPEFAQSTPKSIQRMNNTETDGARFEGL